MKSLLLTGAFSLALALGFPAIAQTPPPPETDAPAAPGALPEAPTAPAVANPVAPAVVEAPPAPPPPVPVAQADYPPCSATLRDQCTNSNRSAMRQKPKARRKAR